MSRFRAYQITYEICINMSNNCKSRWFRVHITAPQCLSVHVKSIYQPLYCGVIECFTTTFLRAHSWLNWVDEDDDEDEVGLKEKPEDTRYIKKITSK